MVQFWITLQKLVQYNIKIIFGNKFLYFMLSALAFLRDHGDRKIVGR